jgi:hypothetical protein
MPASLFTFVQMELPWALGPPDGRYLLRKPAVPDEGEPQNVLVLSTLGAERRGLLGRRARTRRTNPLPATVPVTRATVVDAVALSAERQARAWLSELDPEREAQVAAAALNRLLFAHRIASAEVYTREVAPAQALVIRAGFGEGEQVAEGRWTEARELLLSQRSAHRRAGVLRPQERLAGLLSGKGLQALLCEELALRARADLEQGRPRHAAVELERAYAAALRELGREQQGGLADRIGELRELLEGVELAARVAIGEQGDDASGEGHLVSGAITGTEQLDETHVRHALERLEAALRARTALGFSVR